MMLMMLVLLDVCVLCGCLTDLCWLVAVVLTRAQQETWHQAGQAWLTISQAGSRGREPTARKLP